jgi:hypothetical protein
VNVIVPLLFPHTFTRKNKGAFLSELLSIRARIREQIRRILQEAMLEFKNSFASNDFRIFDNCCATDVKHSKGIHQTLE